MRVLKVCRLVNGGGIRDEVYHEVLLDDDDYLWAKRFKWIIVAGNGQGLYVKSRMLGKYYYLHHFINGVPLPGFVTDHIDRNGLNNQRSNLRVVHHRQNGCNKERSKSCEYLGVCLDKSKKTFKYKASIMIHGKTIHLGRFKTAEEASKKYQDRLTEIGEQCLVLK